MEPDSRFLTICRGLVCFCTSHGVCGGKKGCPVGAE